MRYYQKFFVRMPEINEEWEIIKSETYLKAAISKAWEYIDYTYNQVGDMILPTIEIRNMEEKDTTKTFHLQYTDYEGIKFITN